MGRSQTLDGGGLPCFPQVPRPRPHPSALLSGVTETRGLDALVNVRGDVRSEFPGVPVRAVAGGAAAPWD